MKRTCLTLALAATLSAHAEIIPQGLVKFYYARDTKEIAVMVGLTPSGLTSPGMGFRALVQKSNSISSLFRFERLLAGASYTASGFGGLYVVKKGDVLTAAAISANRFPLLVGGGQGRAVDRPWAQPGVIVGRDYWLAVGVRGVPVDDPSVDWSKPLPPKHFGWLHLRVNAWGEPELLDSVMAYDEPGLVVGEKTPCLPCGVTP